MRTSLYRIVCMFGIAMMALALADIVTTVIFMNVEIGLNEGNRLADHAFNAYGQWPVYLAKMLITALLVSFVVWTAKFDRFSALIALAAITFACFTQAQVVRHNVEAIIGNANKMIEQHNEMVDAVNAYIEQYMVPNQLVTP